MQAKQTDEVIPEIDVPAHTVTLLSCLSPTCLSVGSRKDFVSVLPGLGGTKIEDYHCENDSVFTFLRMF